jgi:hypothetical protein
VDQQLSCCRKNSPFWDRLYLSSGHYSLGATISNNWAFQTQVLSLQAGTYTLWFNGDNPVDGYDVFVDNVSLTSVPSTAPPNLAVQYVRPNSVAVSWPNSGSYTLQQNSNLATGSWTSSGYSITSATGTNSITITLPLENLFFRLQQ